VSIKNKLVTAVTTAGLLAGLFGSAFVPAVRAAADAIEDTESNALNCEGTYVDFQSTIASAANKCYVQAGKAFSVSLSTTGVLAGTLAFDGDSTGGSAGDAIVLAANTSYSIAASVSDVITGWVTPSVASAVTLANTSLSNDGKTAGIGTGAKRQLFASAAAKTNAQIKTGLGLVTKLALTAPAAGASYTLTFKSLTGTTSTTLHTMTVNGVAYADLGSGKPTAYTSNAALQTTTRTLSDDVTADGTTAINGTSSVNNSVDYISATYNGASTAGTAGEYAVTYIIKDAYGIAVKSDDKQYQATVSPSDCGTIGVGADIATAVGALADVSSVAVGAANGTLVVAVDHPGAAYGCKATVTLTHLSSGKVIDTWSLGFLGETDSLTLTGPSHVAANLASNEDMEDQLVVVAKDSNGIEIPGTFADHTFTALDADGVALTITPTDTPDTDADDGGGGTVGNAEEGGTADNNKYGFLATGLCPASSEGKVRTIYVEGETRAVALTKAKSNTISVTCTGKLAYVSAIAFGKTSYYPSESATVTLTMKDSAGRTAGVGSYMANTGFAISNSPATGGSATTEPATYIDSLDANDNAGADAGEKGILVSTAGTAEWSYTMGTAAGVAGFLFDIADNDGATTGSQQGLFTVKTVVTAAFAAVSDATISAGPKKLVATATFGAAAGKKVAFVLENASGVTKTYYRKANASGVAKYTIALRGTWTVYATFGDEITDTVTLRK